MLFRMDLAFVGSLSSAVITSSSRSAFSSGERSAAFRSVFDNKAPSLIMPGEMAIPMVEPIKETQTKKSSSRSFPSRSFPVLIIEAELAMSTGSEPSVPIHNKHSSSGISNRWQITLSSTGQIPVRIRSLRSCKDCGLGVGVGAGVGSGVGWHVPSDHQ